MANVKVSGVLFAALGAALLMVFTPRTVPAGSINAPAVDFTTQTATATVTIGPQTYQVTATSLPLQFFTNCYFITNGMAAQFPTTNFAFAGYGVAANVPQIAASDFTVSQYMPWAVNNNNTTNFLTGPDQVNYSWQSLGLPRGSATPGTNLDAGGAEILISYAPQNNGTDPTSVNFLQGLIRSSNGGPFSSGSIDSGPNSPFYNADSLAGTGTTRRRRTVPLVTTPAMPGPPATAAVPAWMIDIPGHGQASGTFSWAVTFQAFIESDQMINGKMYDVLYGGVQWGYTVTSTAVPEPATLILLSEMIAIVSIGYFWRRRKANGRTIASGCPSA